MPADPPIFDAFTYLAFLAGRTERLRLGTHVYNLGLRHPFTDGARCADARRAFGRTLRVRHRRVVARGGVGRGAARLRDAAAARVDEVVEVCKRLWTEETISHHGEFFSFDEVAFEPKPVQKPWPPILVGGESKAALRRAAAPRRRLDRHGPHVRVGRGADRDCCASYLAEHGRDADDVPDRARRPGRRRATTSSGGRSSA